MDASLLRESFDLIATSKEEFVIAFYQRMFEKYPETQQFFTSTDMSKQVKALAGALAVVVTSVEQGDDITPTLRALGERHKGYGVQSQHYPIVSEILIETFQNVLGPQWTPAFEATWTQAFTLITQTMLSQE